MLIYHISDLHIRAGDYVKSRFYEYQEVFDTFGDIINKETRKCCVVITGDIFHDKNRIDSGGVKLFYDFINKLSKCQVFIIRGNHDYKQSNADEIDLITSLLTPKLDNITYLDTTGIYETEFAIFGVLTIQDTLVKGNASATAKNKVKFPKAPKKTAKPTIALFHGEPLYSDMFKGWEYALLGDIHVQKVWAQGNTKTGFAGSMIRQNKGETINGHGYLLWNLEIGKVSMHDIPNSFCVATDANANVSNSDSIKLKDLSTELASTSFPHYVLKEGGTGKHTDVILHPSKNLQIDSNNITNAIIKDKIRERNDRITKSLSVSETYTNKCNDKNQIKFLNMSWNWLLCYEENNTFDFLQMDDNISCLLGNNATGKTSFLEILIIALFGSGFPSRTNKSLSASIINYKRPANARSNVQLCFKINTRMFKISRAFSTQDSTKLHIISKGTHIDEYFADEGWKNIKSGKTSVDEWVKNNIGEKNTILMTSVISQNQDNDFLSCNALEQKDILDDILNVKEHTSLLAVLNEAQLAYKYIDSLISAVLQSTSSEANAQQQAGGSNAPFKKTTKQLRYVPTDLHDKDYYSISPKTSDVLAEVGKLLSASGTMRSIENDNDLKQFYKEHKKSLQSYLNVNIPSDISTEEVVSDEDFEVWHQKYQNINGVAIMKEEYNKKCKYCIARSKFMVDDVEEYATYLYNVKYRKDKILGKLKYLVEEYDIRQYIFDNYADIQSHIYYSRLPPDIKELFEVQNVINEKLKTVQDLICFMNKYNNDLYANIVDVLTNNISSIVQVFDPSLSLSGVIGERGAIEWYTQSGISNVITPFHKASGFQKFVISIAFRLVFSHIGKIQLKQLFIDEGFSSCDENNINLVPDFLKKLLASFHFSSILIITHIDRLKGSFNSIKVQRS
jgi:DNA repair exonuclease SbcCD ATPase subunit/DNA repair exonuclease SbcCD nuclease subunit